MYTMAHRSFREKAKEKTASPAATLACRDQLFARAIFTAQVPAGRTARLIRAWRMGFKYESSLQK
jgi:hypothetical protein